MVRMTDSIRKNYSLLGLFKKNAEEYLKAHKLEEELPGDVKELCEKLKAAREIKDYALSDALRAEILSKGYAVMINKDGVTVKKQ